MFKYRFCPFVHEWLQQLYKHVYRPEFSTGRTGPDIVKRETTFCTLPRALRTKPFVVLILFDSVEHFLDSPKHHQLQHRNYRSMSHLFEKNMRSRDLQGCRRKARYVTVTYIYYLIHFYCIYIWVDVNGGHGGNCMCY